MLISRRLLGGLLARGGLNHWQKPAILAFCPAPALGLFAKSVYVSFPMRKWDSGFLTLDSQCVMNRDKSLTNHLLKCYLKFYNLGKQKHKKTFKGSSCTVSPAFKCLADSNEVEWCVIL